MAKSEEEEAKASTTSTDIRTAVETAGSADESAGDDEDEQEEDANSEAEDEETGDDEDSKDTEDEDESAKTDKDESKGDSDKDESKGAKDSEYRFTQFAGDGKAETYIGNLEKAYENSSAEGIRLNNELQQSNRRFEAIKQAVTADPDLADKLKAALTGSPSSAAPKGEAEPTTDPFLVNARTEWEKKSTEEAQEFINANPEVVSNPDVNKAVKHWMEVFSAEEYKNNGTLMTAGEAMSKAYKYLGYEDKREQRKSMGDTKKAAASSPAQGSRKPAKTATDFTDSQIKFGEALGLSREKLDKFGK